MLGRVGLFRGGFTLGRTLLGRVGFPDVPSLWRNPRLFSWAARDLGSTPFLGATPSLDRLDRLDRSVRARALTAENGTFRAGLVYLLAL